MPAISSRPDLGSLEVPIDAWTAPFWTAAAEGKLLLPRCGACARFRWPPGPFCPHCHSQNVEWTPSGSGRVYSFTVVHSRPGQVVVPALIEFPEAQGVRLPAAIVDTALASVHIGAAVELDWSQAVNAAVPVFRVA